MVHLSRPNGVRRSQAKGKPWSILRNDNVARIASHGHFFSSIMREISRIPCLFVCISRRACRETERMFRLSHLRKFFEMQSIYIYIYFEDSSNYELREEFVYRLNEILILLGWFRSTIDESWKRLGFIDPRSPCKHASMYKGHWTCHFHGDTTIFEIEEAATPCECVDYRFYWCVEKWPARFDSRRYFFLFFLLYENFLSMNSKIEGNGF